MEIKIKILRKGDEVLNVFNYLQNTAISVKRKKGNVDIILLEANQDNIPEITSTWSICEGNNEIEISKDNIKISTF